MSKVILWTIWIMIFALKKGYIVLSTSPVFAQPVAEMALRVNLYPWQEVFMKRITILKKEKKNMEEKKVKKIFY